MEYRESHGPMDHHRKGFRFAYDNSVEVRRCLKPEGRQKEYLI
jgi:hypothetical protein